MLKIKTITPSQSVQVLFQSDQDKLSDQKLADLVVSLANGQGGEIYLGLESSGKATGIHPDRTDLQRLRASITGNTVPSVLVSMELIQKEGKSILKISVPARKGIFCTRDGRFLKSRKGHDNQMILDTLSPEVHSPVEKYAALNDETAKALKMSTLEDLDFSLMPLLRQMLQSVSREPWLDRLEDCDLLRTLGLTALAETEEKPTVAGLLMMGRSDRIRQLIPGAMVLFTVYQGSSFIQEYSLWCGPLLTFCDKFSSWFSLWSKSRTIKVGTTNLEFFDYSAKAFREGLLNAICHRDYSIKDPIQVHLNEEGLTITSPGLFPDSFLQENPVLFQPKIRNPLLVSLLKRTGFITANGRGIDCLYQETLRYGLPLPQFSNTSRKEARLFLPKGEPDSSFTRLLVDQKTGCWKPLPICSLMILYTLRKEESLCEEDLESLIPYEKNRIALCLKSLCEQKLISICSKGHQDLYRLVLKNESSSVHAFVPHLVRTSSQTSVL